MRPVSDFSVISLPMRASWEEKMDGTIWWSALGTCRAVQRVSLSRNVVLRTGLPGSNLYFTTLTPRVLARTRSSNLLTSRHSAQPVRWK